MPWMTLINEADRIFNNANVDIIAEYKEHLEVDTSTLLDTLVKGPDGLDTLLVNPNSEALTHNEKQLFYAYDYLESGLDGVARYNDGRIAAYIVPSVFPGGTNYRGRAEPTVDSLWINGSTISTNPESLAHEIGHILLDDGAHDWPNNNLMALVDRRDGTDLTGDQITTMQNKIISNPRYSR